MHISKVHSGKQYVNSKREPQKNMPGSDCEWRVLFSAIAPRKAEQRGREIREPTKSRGTQQGLSPQGCEKGDYRQVEPQPVISASSVQSQKDPNSSRISIPSGLRELRGAGWTKQLDWNSSHLIQTPLFCPGCGSSFTLHSLLRPGELGRSWSHSCIRPECLPPAPCFQSICQLQDYQLSMRNQRGMTETIWQTSHECAWNRNAAKLLVSDSRPEEKLIYTFQNWSRRCHATLMKRSLYFLA